MNSVDEKKSQLVTLLSFPRSGNHLVRLLIEYLTQKPTLGCKGSPRDIPMYRRHKSGRRWLGVNPNAPAVVQKAHFINKVQSGPKYPLVLIIRNPWETTRSFKKGLKAKKSSQQLEDEYRSLLEFYQTYKYKKMCIYYEDILSDKQGTLQLLGDFFGVSQDRIELAKTKADWLYNVSKKHFMWGKSQTGGKLVYFWKPGDTIDFNEKLYPLVSRYQSAKLIDQ